MTVVRIFLLCRAARAQTETQETLSLRDPSQLVVGNPNTSLTKRKHHPSKLVESNIQYSAQVRTGIRL